jgi:hypothetical protein
LIACKRRKSKIKPITKFIVARLSNWASVAAR